MTTKSMELGRAGEKIAAQYLQDSGYRILEMNWRSSQGELDIIAIKGRVAVAIEVKSRSGSLSGHPLEAITKEKMNRLYRLLEEWQRESEWRGQLRVDAIALIKNGESWDLDHVEGIGQ